MSNTPQQEPIPFLYHKIQAPTIEDREFGIKYKKRKLTDGTEIEHYRTNEFYLLKDLDWIWYEKIDGSNIRVYWDGHQVIYNGRTNKADICPEIKEFIKTHFLEERFEEKFGEDEVLLILEAVGPKIRGGKYNYIGNKAKYPNHKTILLDVKVGKVWLERTDIKNIDRIADHFEVNTAECYGKSSLKDMITAIAKGWCRKSDEDLMEGFVGTPIGNFLDRQGRRIIAKVKDKDYNVKVRLKSK